MGLIPPLPKLDIDVKGVVDEFLGLMRSMNAKLDTLIELHSSPQNGGVTEYDADDPILQAEPIRFP